MVVLLVRKQTTLLSCLCVRRKHVLAISNAKTAESGQLSSYEHSELETCARWNVLPDILGAKRTKISTTSTVHVMKDPLVWVQSNEVSFDLTEQFPRLFIRDRSCFDIFWRWLSNKIFKMGTELLEFDPWSEHNHQKGASGFIQTRPIFNFFSLAQ